MYFNSEGPMLDATELRSIAHAARKAEKAGKEQIVKPTPEEVEYHLSQLAATVRVAAEASQLSATYAFEATKIPLLEQVAKAFRHRVGKGFLVMKQLGPSPKIVVRFDGNYHV